MPVGIYPNTLVFMNATFIIQKVELIIAQKI